MTGTATAWRAIFICVAAAAGVLTACSGDGGAGNSTGPPPTGAARPSSPAKIQIVDPQPGMEYSPDQVPVRVELSGARVTKKVSTDLSPTEGHIHLSVDGRIVTLLAGLDENLADLVDRPLEAGPHLLEVEFVASDHGPFDPRVISSVSFTVR